jgi:hypothetical protein
LPSGSSRSQPRFSIGRGTRFAVAFFFLLRGFGLRMRQSVRIGESLISAATAIRISHRLFCAGNVLHASGFADRAVVNRAPSDPAARDCRVSALRLPSLAQDDGAAARHAVRLIGGARALPWHPQQEQNRSPLIFARKLAARLACSPSDFAPPHHPVSPTDRDSWADCAKSRARHAAKLGCGAGAKTD